VSLFETKVAPVSYNLHESICIWPF